MMLRRKFIERFGCLVGGTLLSLGSWTTISSCSRTSKNKISSWLLGDREAEILNEMADIIIPPTDTPGAKSADVGTYIVKIHNDCMSDEEQIKNISFFDEIVEFTKEAVGEDFLLCSHKQKEKVIKEMDEKQIEGFLRYKGLIVEAFLSSEIGSSLFMKYTLVPGRYDGCSSDRPW